MSARLTTGERRAGAEGLAATLRARANALPAGIERNRLLERIARLERIAAAARDATVAEVLDHLDDRERRDLDL